MRHIWKTKSFCRLC